MSFINNLYSISQADLTQAIYFGLFYGTISSFYILLTGKILNIHALISDLINGNHNQNCRKKITILIGLIFISSLVKTLHHESLLNINPYENINTIKNTSQAQLIIAGLMVGFGSQYTLKYCGQQALSFISQINLPSIFYTVLYLGTSMMVINYNIYLQLPSLVFMLNLPENVNFSSYLIISLILPFLFFTFSGKKSVKSLIQLISLFTIGCFIGILIMLMGVSKRSVVFSAMKIDQKWQPSLFIIGIIGVIISFISTIIMKYIIKKPFFNSYLDLNSSKINIKGIIGVLISGIGFGLGGLNFLNMLIILPLKSMNFTIYWGLSYILGCKSAQIFKQNMIGNNKIN